MYLQPLDVVAVTIALVAAVALIITSSTANARLIRENTALRSKVSALRNHVR